MGRDLRFQRRVTGSGIFTAVRVRTTVTIEEELLRAIDEIAKSEQGRSDWIEGAARQQLERQARVERELRDLEILDRSSEALNREMEDVLRYQVDGAAR